MNSRKLEPRIIMFRNISVASMLSFWLLLMPASLLHAHDFWIEPSTFQPSIGEPVDLTLRVGQDFGGDSQPYITHWFSDYRAVGPNTEYAIEGMIGDDPAGHFVPRAAGVHIIGYRSTRNFVEMEPGKFDAYLEKEGLDGPRAERARTGQTHTAGRELYSRCAKSLINAGNTVAGGDYDRFLGYTLELIPERNPYTLSAGDRLPVRLLYETEPLEGALVIAFSSDRPENKLRQRTDANGRVTLDLPHAGTWLVKAVHIVAVPENEQRAEWESFWASMTFRLPSDR